MLIKGTTKIACHFLANDVIPKLYDIMAGFSKPGIFM